MTDFKVSALKDGKPSYKASLTSTSASSATGSVLQVSGVWVSKSSLRDLKGQPLRLPVTERESLEERMARNAFAAAASKRSAPTQKTNKPPKTKKKGKCNAAAPNTAPGTRASKAAAAAAPADGASAASGSAAATLRSGAVI